VAVTYWIALVQTPSHHSQSNHEAPHKPPPCTQPMCMQTPDSELWRALDLVHLRQAVAELAGGLDAPVVEGGANFSVGQKQLVSGVVCIVELWQDLGARE